MAALNCFRNDLNRIKIQEGHAHISSFAIGGPNETRIDIDRVQYWCGFFVLRLRRIIVFHGLMEGTSKRPSRLFCEDSLLQGRVFRALPSYINLKEENV